MKKLLDNAADIDHVNKYKRSAIYYAVLDGKEKNTANEKQNILFKIKILNLGNKEIARLLIAFGADVNIEDYLGR